MSGILQLVFASTVGSVGPINTVAPVVSGTAQVRQTLSCTTGTWTGTAPITYAYQWQYGTTNIPGATSSTYTISYLYSGETIRCIVTATNPAGSTPAQSNATSAVAATTPLAPTIGTATATSNTSGQVTFSPNADNGGATVTGFTATSSPGSITGTSSSSPITVSGLTTLTTYNFTVVATNSVGNSPSSGSSNSITPGAVAPVNTATPTIFGAAVVRNTVSSSTGTWTGSPSPSFSYQWQTLSSGDISGATSSDYVIPSSLVGQQLRCRVTGTNVAGSAQAFTPYTSNVQANTPEAPASVSASVNDPINFPLRITVTSAIPDNGGAVITEYDWYRSVDGGSFLAFTSTASNVLVFDGQSGRSYAFKSDADNLIGSSDLSPASNTVVLP